MDAQLLNWLVLPQGGDDAALEGFAERLTSEHQPPIPVGSLLRQRATVKVVPWHEDVDALVQWTDGKPLVLLKELPSHLARRGRMTEAHELAHIAIPWHVGFDVMTCFETDERTGLTTRPNLRKVVEAQEAEARICAGMLLMPARVLRQRQSLTLAQFFNTLDDFDISAPGALMRLRQVLRPGICFWGDWMQRDSWSYPFSTRRTALPPGLGSEADLSRHSLEMGEFTLGNKVTRWYVVESLTGDYPMSDSRRPIDILRGILRDVECTVSESSIAGVVQGTLGHEPRGAKLEQLYSHVAAKCNASPLIPNEVREHPEFSQYLANAAYVRHQKASIESPPPC